MNRKEVRGDEGKVYRVTEMSAEYEHISPRNWVVYKIYSGHGGWPRSIVASDEYRGSSSQEIGRPIPGNSRRINIAKGQGLKRTCPKRRDSTPRRDCLVPAVDVPDDVVVFEKSSEKEVRDHLRVAKPVPQKLVNGAYNVILPVGIESVEKHAKALVFEGMKILYERQKKSPKFRIPRDPVKDVNQIGVEEFVNAHAWKVEKFGVMAYERVRSAKECESVGVFDGIEARQKSPLISRVGGARTIRLKYPSNSLVLTLDTEPVMSEVGAVGAGLTGVIPAAVAGGAAGTSGAER
ncbi:hypothetical protein C8R47DRAFT_1193201 [Mycena vitilis]|nr:hypothetical protein C8R47DRAFT_1193201 [Mycena vitilis]